MRALNAYVAVTKKDGTAVWFAPGDTPPKWAASQITNPDVWEGEEEPRSTTKAASQEPSGDGNRGTGDATGGTPAPDGGEPTPTPDVIPTGDKPADGGDGEPGGDSSTGGVEPLRGEAPKGNATTEEWAQYADANGVAYEPEAGRDAIKEAVEKAAAERAAAETPAD
jgi:hypothetical protein